MAETANTTSDFERPFGDRYLMAAEAMAKLTYALMVVGMSGNRNFDALRADFIAHGGDTYRDMSRDKPSRTS